MRGRTLLAALAVTVLAGTPLAVTAGCGPAHGGTGTEELAVVAWKGGGTEPARIAEINRRFERANPGIRVRFRYVQSNDYDTYNNPRLTAGTAADVLMADKGRMVTWARQGYLADLSDQPWVARMMPGLRPFNSIDGRTYVFSQENIPLGLYTNLDLLARAGVGAVPQTWPEFLAALGALQAKGLGGLLLPSKDGWAAENFAQLLAVNTVHPARPDWAGDYNAGTASFRSDWSPVVEQLKQLLTRRFVDGRLMMGIDPWSQGLDEFKAGRWAFTVQGAWELSDFAANTGFRFSFDPVPGGPAGSRPRCFTFVGTGWAVNARTSHDAAAKRYVDFWARPANATDYLAAENGFSTLTDVKPAVLPQGQPVLDAYTSGRTSPSPAQSLAFTDMETQLKREIQKLFLNPGIPTGDVLDALDKSVPRQG